MKFMTVVVTTNPDKAGAPPPGLFEAITELGIAAGAALKDTGGMKDIGTLRVENHEIVVDGPFAEAKEAIGGFAIYDLPTYDDIRAYCERFLDVHRKHWPAWEGTITVQELITFGPPR
ncbi:MAG TPA: YciI family protein [Devosia sp.]|nr:YciI family protein [Devosia sp.]